MTIWTPREHDLRRMADWLVATGSSRAAAMICAGDYLRELSQAGHQCMMARCTNAAEHPAPVFDANPALSLRKITGIAPVCDDCQAAIDELNAAARDRNQRVSDTASQVRAARSATRS